MRFSFLLLLITTLLCGGLSHAQSGNSEPLNTPYMLRGNFYAYASTSEGLGGYATSENLPKTGVFSDFKNAEAGVWINTGKSSGYYTAYVYNNSVHPTGFAAQDSRLNMVIQAKDEDGEWKDIMYLPSSWCGNSYHTLVLQPKEYWEFTVPQFEGEFETELRLKVFDWHYRPKDSKGPLVNEVAYSNTFHGSINRSQFSQKEGYQNQGIMDPYDN